MNQEPVLITGAAGFIGFHLAKKLCHAGQEVIGIDNLNAYYEVSLKEARLKELGRFQSFRFIKLDLTDREALRKLFDKHGFRNVVHLAAQAGVRYSIQNPYAYLDSNLHGFLNILECCRHTKVDHLLYASSSSVYGANRRMPFSEHQCADHPISLYGATKKANELMAHAYAAMYNLPVTGLRFFTVYGPYGRPDMALFLFTKAIIDGTPIDVYNNGKMKRDFTYVDDIVEGVSRLIPRPPAPDPTWTGEQPDPATSLAPYRLYNIGNNQPVELSRFIEAIETRLRRRAIKNYLPMQQGDVPETHANVDDLVAAVGFKPQTTIEEGVAKFIDWYLQYYHIKTD